MPVEKLIEEITKQREIIVDAVRKQDELLDNLKVTFMNSGDSDWMSVKAAANRLGRSLCFVYQLINNGRLKSVKHIGSCKYVRMSEIDSLNDTPEL